MLISLHEVTIEIVDFRIISKVISCYKPLLNIESLHLEHIVSLCDYNSL